MDNNNGMNNGMNNGTNNGVVNEKHEGTLNGGATPIETNNTFNGTLNGGVNPIETQNNPYGQQNNPYGQQNNPYGQQNNPYGQQNNPYGQPNNQYGQPNNPYAQQQGGYNPYGQQGGFNQPPMNNEGDLPGKGLGIAGFILSIVSFVVCCFGSSVGWVCFITVIVGLVLSIISRSKAKKAGRKNGLATAGMIISIIFIVLWVIVFALAIIGIAALGEEFFKAFEEYGIEGFEQYADIKTKF